MEWEWITSNLIERTKEEDYQELWGEAERLLPHFSYDDIRTIVALVTETCPYCYANDRSCQCSNDE